MEKTFAKDSSRIADFDGTEEDYAFAGMAHIFDQHVGSAVTCLAFARRSRIGFGDWHFSSLQWFT